MNKLLEKIEAVTKDSKREVLEVLIGKLEKESPLRICIWCSSRATASYLHTVLAERGTKVWLLTGDNSPQQFNEALDGFRQSGGVLIATIFALQGIELRDVPSFVHYDPPASDAEMRVRITRNRNATHYLLKDESGVLPEELAVRK